MLVKPVQIRIRAAARAGIAVLAITAVGLVLAQSAAAIPSPIIIGLNDGAGWGTPDSTKFHERGFTSERLEAGGPYTKIKESTELGWTNDVVIVGNTPDETQLSSINVSTWTSETLAQIKELTPYGVTLFEVGNEMFLKGPRCGGCYQQKEPAKYAEMYVSLSKAVEKEGISGIKLLFNSYGDYQLSEGGGWSQVCCGGGWLATAEKAQPELLKRVQGFTMHPYGAAGENKENDWGPGALKVEHEQAVSLGYEHTDYYATEFGIKLEESGGDGSTSKANQAEKIGAVYSELAGFGYVKGIWYYQSHDDGTGKWGLIEHQESGESPFEPRPSLETVANYALTYEGPNTEAATSVSSSGATLNGSINPEGVETHYKFEYGTTTSYGSVVPASEPSIGSGHSGVAVSLAISGLSASTTYHYRLVAKRGSYTVKGLDHTLTTSSSSPTNTAPPTIASSVPIVGYREAASTGTWSGGPTSYSYQWQRCNSSGTGCTNISGATSATYTPVEADAEHTLVVVVTATNGGGSTPASSSASSIVRGATWATMPPLYASSFGSAGTGSGQFNHPGDVALDAKGNVWALDNGNSRIEEFNEKGEYVKAFGTAGTGTGQLKFATALALDASGDVWVVDGGNNRVDEFNEKGEFVRSFGTAGSGAGQFESPEGIAVAPNGNVWVADTYHGRLEVFNEKGEYLKTVGSSGSGEGHFGEPQDLAIDANGNVFAADWTYSRIAEFNEKGEFVRQFGSVGTGLGQMTHPYGIAVDAADRVWVADNGNNRVDVFNETGGFLYSFASSGSGAGQVGFSWPIGVAVDGRGSAWVTDPGGNRVEKWTAPSYPPSYLSAFGSLGTGSGQFNHPGAVAVDPKGNVWALDVENARVEEFNEKAEFVKATGSLGSGNGQLKFPRALACDSKGNVWVADAGNNRIEEFNEKGEFVRVFGTLGTEPGQMERPEGIAVAANGNVWVADTYHGRVEVFNEKGEYLKPVGSKGTGEGQIGEPQNLGIDANGNVFVADWSNSRVDEFNEKGEYVRQFGSAQLGRPYGMAVDGAGNPWVFDAGSDRVVVFNGKGESVTKFGTEGTGAGQFTLAYPIGLAINSAGVIWATDSSDNRIEEWQR